MYGVRHFYIQLKPVQDSTVSPSDPVLNFLCDWVYTFWVLIAPTLVFAQMFLSSVMSENFLWTLRTDGEIFLHIWHHTICELCNGSAGPEIKDRVHPIFEKNSSLIGTPRLFTLFFFWVCFFLGPV